MLSAAAELARPLDEIDQQDEEHQAEAQDRDRWRELDAGDDGGDDPMAIPVTEEGAAGRSPCIHPTRAAFPSTTIGSRDRRDSGFSNVLESKRRIAAARSAGAATGGV